MDEKTTPQTKLILTADDGVEHTVLSPRLAELMNRDCSTAELQAALVHLIELYNEQGKRMQTAIHELQDYKENKSLQDLLGEPFTI